MVPKKLDFYGIASNIASRQKAVEDFSDDSYERIASRASKPA